MLSCIPKLPHAQNMYVLYPLYVILYSKTFVCPKHVCIIPTICHLISQNFRMPKTCMYYTHCMLSYITNLVCYTYFHWFFSPECQHIFGKQTGYIFQSPKTIITCTTKHYASLNQWYNTE